MPIPIQHPLAGGIEEFRRINGRHDSKLDKDATDPGTNPETHGTSIKEHPSRFPLSPKPFAVPPPPIYPIASNLQTPPAHPHTPPPPRTRPAGAAAPIATRAGPPPLVSTRSLSS